MGDEPSNEFLVNLTVGIHQERNNTSTQMIHPPFGNPLDNAATRITMITLFAAVTVTCILGNSLVLCVILRHRKMRNLTNFFLANLAVADLCVGLFCIMQTLATQLSDFWHLGKVMCKLYFFVQVASYTASLLLLTLISVERYFAIIHPILSKRVTGMGIMRGAVVVVWIVSIAYSTPSLFSQHISLTVPELIPGTNTSHNVTYEFCHDSTIVDVKIFVLVNFVLMYLIPLILMSVVYTRISVLLWQTSNLGAGGEGMLRANSSNGSLPMNRIRSTVQSSSTKHYHGYNHKQYADPAQKSLIRTNSKTNTYCDVTEVTVEEDLSPNSDDQSPARPAPLNMQDHGPVVIQKRAPNGIRKDASKKSSKKSPRSSNPFIARRKVIRLLIAIVISFAICVLPHHIRLLVHIWFRTEKSRVDNIMVPVTFLIFYFNSCLNPFLYAFLSDNFRKAFCELVWFKCFKSRARKGSALYVTNRTVPYTVPTVALRHDQDKVTNC